MQYTIPMVCYVFMYLKITVKLHSHLPDVGTWINKVSELIFIVNQNQWCHILNTSMYILWWELRLFCMFSYLITGKAIIPTSVTNMTWSVIEMYWMFENVDVQMQMRIQYEQKFADVDADAW